MLVSIRPPPSLLSSVRLIHASSRTCNLIAPPDPVSHMRPIIYSDAPPPAPPSFIRHPYSLTEFYTSPKKRGDSELQFKLLRQSIDEFHQNFWFDSNTRFEAAKQAVLAGLPPSATPADKENALSQFYKHWYMQESAHTGEYTTEWRRRNITLLKLAARVEYEKIATRCSELFSFKRSSQ
ncbi:hypothetical protein Hypma_011645 [Hypsizygus marmoreus]|uniref:Apoptogenic protein 1, mitochondrial n=1 Tax=Hypsizygus marmoreus TaxID=39966 RepID=A0A369JP08_HYPMA|nr:hypothetical protein Hypma_011645 [Hypsizygus marmoreus]